MSDLPSLVAVWIEARFGAPITKCERQPRWRPSWFVDVGSTPLYVRGERGAADHGVYGLDHEYKVLELLARHGIAVPRVYGMTDDPPCIVMEAAPGRTSLATATDDAERDAVLRQYVDALVEIHSIPRQEVEAIGLAYPQSPTELSLADYDRWVAAYRKRQAHREPLLEFVMRWLTDNAPTAQREAKLTHGDAGQFLFADGQMTAVIDLELACVGDPAAEFSVMAIRDVSEPMGSLAGAMAHYTARTGTAIDLDIVRYHIIRYGAYVLMTVAPIIVAPSADIEPLQYLTWYTFFSRVTIEFIAKLSGVALTEPDPLEPAALPARAYYETLIEMLEPKPDRDAHVTYDFATARRLAVYLRQNALFQAAVDRDDNRDIATLLGLPVSAVTAPGQQLAEAVAARVLPDEELIRYFYRRARRWEDVVLPAMGPHGGRRLQFLD